jgi:hypothetical protein
LGALRLKNVVVESDDVETTVPVAPLVPPVTVSPTVKSVLGIMMLKVVEVTIEAIVVVAPLVPPVMVSPATKVPLTLLTVNKN